MLRGDTVDNPKYAGKHVFSTGINLTHIYNGQDFVSLVRHARDGLREQDVPRPRAARTSSPDEVYGGTLEKPWVAGVEAFAIGGGCQYLLTMDYVVAASDAYMTLPARKEGIIPGAANMRHVALHRRQDRPAGDHVGAAARLRHAGRAARSATRSCRPARWTRRLTA